MKKNTSSTARGVKSQTQASILAQAEPAYCTSLGTMHHGTVEQWLNSDSARQLRGKIQLIFTSPPFPLNRKKKYGNRQGVEYVRWLANLAPKLTRLLTPNGSIVIEIGNAWEPGEPVMSVLGVRSLLAFLKRGDLKLCQQFICHNSARLPSPIQWVNVERVRVKDTFTHVWWMSPTSRPLARNRNVLVPYSGAMKRLIETKKYNAGNRPSEHVIGKTSFLKDNGGAIPSNVLTFANTSTEDDYQKYCRAHGIKRHPARMPAGLAEFFVKFLTVEGDIVLDPFGGSNTTGAVAENLKRRWVSVEPMKDYVIASMARFQGRLIDIP